MIIKILKIIMASLAIFVGFYPFKYFFGDSNVGLLQLKTEAILHRTIGIIYVSAALVSSLAGIYIACYAIGGIIASSGFMCLGLFWFYSTYKAYSSIRERNIKVHQEMMIYSYAACLAAVNLLVAFYINKRWKAATNTILQNNS